jgi:hypothetical protein
MPLAPERETQSPGRTGRLAALLAGGVLSLLFLLLLAPVLHPVTLHWSGQTLLLGIQPSTGSPRTARGFFRYDLAPIRGRGDTTGGPMLLRMLDGREYRVSGTARLRGLHLWKWDYYLVWFRGRRVK